ncbi:3-hydroxyacyl-ACP dehydratase FabZ [Staphylococcus shinii]|uniref:3-hydroxyacyl-ACP dehydratase FabZ n=1 Tax=Staphylococcus shinii TaxID=2912228 RepID=UPI003CEA3366
MEVSINTIIKMLPHDFPFLFVDKVENYKKGSITALKNVSYNEPFFQGHFPHNPTFPGVILVECAAQSAAIMYILDEIFLSNEDIDISEDNLHNFIEEGNLKDKVGYLASIKNVKFLEVVQPGDSLNIFVKKKLSSYTISDLEFKITNKEKTVCNGRMTVTKNANQHT